MKKILFFGFLLIASVLTSRADAQADFAKNISAYNSELAHGKYMDAARSLSRATEACTAVKNYEGAFNLITNAERQLGAKSLTADSLPGVYYVLAKAKFNIYQTLKNGHAAQSQLKRMADLAARSGDRNVLSSMLFSAAQYYYSVNEDKKGDQCIAKLIRQYDSASDYKGADTAYKTIINKAVSANDARLVEHTYESYMQWSDSIEALNADSELAKVQKEYQASQDTIAQKDKTIRGKSGLIATFIVLFVAALAAIGFIIWLYFRIMAKNRRMRQKVEEAKEQSAAKSAILHNLSTTMAPALEKLDADNPAVKNLRGYVERVGELSEVDDAEPKSADELQDVNLEKFCQGLVDAIADKTQPGVKIHTDVARGTAQIDTEEVGKILGHLLDNAAKYTPADGKITLSYKKRGAKVHQFIVSDSGPGIPKDQRETLFKAFSSTTDITQGDGLGLPICARRAEKLNGTLELDGDHSIGATFVLTIRQ